MKGLIYKYMKSNWKSDYFGGGRTIQAKARLKRILKKKAYNEFKRDYIRD